MPGTARGYGASWSFTLSHTEQCCLLSSVALVMLSDMTAKRQHHENVFGVMTSAKVAQQARAKQAKRECRAAHPGRNGQGR